MTERHDASLVHDIAWSASGLARGRQGRTGCGLRGVYACYKPSA